jgi:hypothetical protein
MFLGVYTSGSDVAVIEIESDQISWYDYLTSSYRYELRTTQVLRDPSAWYHIMCVLDTTQATSSNRNKIYINGSLVTALTTATYPTQNLDGKFNTAVQHSIGTEGSNLRLFLDAYQTETYFIDGQALTPSDFGETDSATGVWKPRAYSSTYGTNGFYLKFADNSGTTSTTLGKDSSGNGNNWTPNNFSVTAGAGNDSMVDSPTLSGTDTGVGGEVRGNYATLNPLDWGQGSDATFSDGNLRHLVTNTTGRQAWSTLAIPDSGKWYFEATYDVLNSSQGQPVVAVSTLDKSIITVFGLGVESTGGYLYRYTSGAVSAYTTVSAGDTFMFAIDRTGQKAWIGKNGTWLGSGNPSAGTNPAEGSLVTAGPYLVYNQDRNNSQTTFNFGQRAFAYTAPSGFKALCTTNLPTPTIGATSTTQAGDYFNVVTYTGNGTAIGSGGLTVSGVGFQPDFVWGKRRDTTGFHGLVDSIRGGTKLLFSNSTDAETTYSEGISTFNADGFTVGNLGNFNTLNGTYVAWNWNAGGSNATNTSGTITSTVRANTTSGFSIVTYTGTGSNATVGHGLGVAPSMIIVKNRSSAQTWRVYSSVIGATQYLNLNATTAAQTSSIPWNNTAPTSTVFSVGTDDATNKSSENLVAYAFAPVAGYSAFGSYVGNGSTDGVFVYLGFRPRFIMRKRTDSTGSWIAQDSARPGYNATTTYTSVLYPNASDAELSYNEIDILSNGFKIRANDSFGNASGGTYIYMALAENPFKYALAR